jgi:hypothetical protein
LQDTDREIRLKVLNQVRDSLGEFVRIFCNSSLTSKTPEFHKELYEIIPNTPRLVLAAPRGFAKSYIVSRFYPLWLAIMMKKRDIVIISASETLAIEHLRWIKRELESNKDLFAFFGRKWISDKWTENHIILNNAEKVNIRARGAGGQIRGFRPDCIILDDIETDESVTSEEQRNKLRDWIFKACINALTPDGQFMMIGTVIHTLCLLNEFLQDDREGWVRRRYRAYVGEQKAGNELWAELWSHDRLQKQKTDIGTFAFSSEFLNDPLSNETAPIKDNHIRYYDTLPNQYSCVISVDPAYSDDAKSDYKVASVVAIDPQQNRYLVEYIRTHAPIGEFQNSIINLYIRYKDRITGVGIPNQGVEKSFFDSFSKKCLERRVIGIPISELSNTFTNTASGVSARNKKSRIIASLQPLFEQGKYYIRKEHIEAKDELLTIGASRWDDLVDTLSYAEQILQPVYYDAKEMEQYQLRPVHRGVTGYGSSE